MVVANVPHLWPLISRVFGLGAFKQVSSGPSGTNQYPLRSHRSGAGMASSRRDKFDIEGYVPTGSEERIATNGDKDGQWGYAKKLDTLESGDADIEMGNQYMSTDVRGGDKGDLGNAGLVIQHEELGGWENDRVNPEKKGQIVETVHIDQRSSESS